MSKYIDAKKFYKKVDELMAHYAKVEKDVKNDLGLSIFYYGKRKMCLEIIDLITSPQQEQPKVDLEKELKNERTKLLDVFGPMNGEQSLAIRNFARHFYELGLNTRKEE